MDRFKLGHLYKLYFSPNDRRFEYCYLLADDNDDMFTTVISLNRNNYGLPTLQDYVSRKNLSVWQDDVEEEELDILFQKEMYSFIILIFSQDTRWNK